MSIGVSGTPFAGRGIMAAKNRSKSREPAKKRASSTPVAAPPRRFAKAFADEFALIVGIATTIIFFTYGDRLLAGLDNTPWFATMFVWLFAVMVWCAFGVVRHAEALAELLGEPYGTLVLTISIITIEVTIMAIVMLSGDANPTLPRDTMFAILMIVLNGIVGVTLVIGALHHGQQHYNLQGAVAFLAVLVPLAVISLVLPEFTQSTTDPTFTPLQATLFGLLTALLYGVFLIIQTSRHRSFFDEPDKTARQGTRAKHAAHDAPMDDRGALYHATLLIATLFPIILLSKPLAAMFNFGIEKIGMPTALGGILIALLVLSPEGLAAIKAAATNQAQRAINLSLGAALSTIGLTVPVVLAISLYTGTPLTLGLGPAEIVLLALTLLVAHMTFSGVPTNILFGFIHIVLFLTYVVLVFAP
jgi:Ca2+:H+ antiporter